MSSGGEGVEGPSRRFFSGGVKPDGEGIGASSSGEFGPIVEATGESKEKEFWVAIPGEATGVANDTFLCFLGIFKYQNKRGEGRCLVVVVVVVVVYCLNAGFSDHVASDHASLGAYRGLS